MRRVGIAGWAGGALAMLAGCAAPPAPAPAAATPVSAEALRALYAAAHREEGTVMSGSHAGKQWTRWTKPDGSAELIAGHGLFADSGHYVLRGEQICWRWGFIDGGREGCNRLVQVGEGEYVTAEPDGTQGSRFKVLPP